MTTITIPRALLEQALETINSFAALSAELAKPVEQVEPVAWMWQHKETGRTGFIKANRAKAWTKLNPRQPLVMPVYSHPPTPAWHDAPETVALKAERDELLDASKNLLDAVETQCEYREGSWTDVWAKKARAAIAKAEGRKK